MRLTLAHKAAYVQAAIRDVPQVDYRTKAHEIARRDVVLYGMPDIVRAAYDKHPQWINTRHTQYGELPSGDPNITPSAQLNESAKAKIAELDIADRDQWEARQRLTRKLKAAVAGCTTTKQLAELIPEFAKYLPREQGKIEFPLAVVNPLADFVKAGWKGASKE